MAAWCIIKLNPWSGSNDMNWKSYGWSEDHPLVSVGVTIGYYF